MVKICFFTATRAEYGLLSVLIDKISNSRIFKSQLVVTGTHLSPQYGNTVDEITKQGQTISETMEIVMSSNSHIGVSKCLGLCVISSCEILDRLKPDFVIILGDRSEMLGIASAALIASIPIIHIHGGEVTEGAIDDSIRHAITKLSSIHFTTTEDYRRRVIQMGEDPKRVFNVGAPGLDAILVTKLVSKRKLETKYHFKIKGPFIIVTVHPETVCQSNTTKIYESLKKVVLQLCEEFHDITFLITGCNSDVGGGNLNKLLSNLAELSPKINFFQSTGHTDYLSFLNQCDLVVGNSSSGIIEVPHFKKWTINIGDRQKGRAAASSVVHVGIESSEIYNAIKYALNKSKFWMSNPLINPYGKGGASTKIYQILRKLRKNVNSKKEFYDI